MGLDVPEGEPRLDVVGGGHVISDEEEALSVSWWITIAFVRRIVEERKAVPVTMPFTVRLLPLCMSTAYDAKSRRPMA